jgi:hypothetical protein
MNRNLPGCVCAALLGAAIVAATPAMARGGFGGGGGHMMGGGGHMMMGGGGHMMGGMGGHPMMSMGGGFAGRSMAMGGFNRGMFTGRSVFVPGGNRFVGAPFAGRHAFVNRRFFDEGRRDRIEERFEDRFRHRRFFFIDNFAFFGVPFAYDYAAYGNGCWRWDGWQWINICNNYGGYNYGY